MNYIRRLVVLLYVTISLFVSCIILLYVSHMKGNIFNYTNFSYLLYLIYYDDSFRYGFGIGAGVLMVLNFIFYQMFSINVHKEKIVAFDNPSGRVTLSLFAMEDLIRRKVIKLPEIKDVKPVINATKSGLKVKIKLILNSEMNIPEITSKVQGMVKKKIQDTIGMEESIDIAIYVGKILPDRTKPKSKETKEDEAEEEKPTPNIPFQGYRA